MMLLIVVCGCRKMMFEQGYNNYPLSRRYTIWKGHRRVGYNSEIKTTNVSDGADILIKEKYHLESKGWT